MFDVYDASTQRAIREAVTLEEAAQASMLEEDDIAWAIEECGRCDAEDVVVVEHGDSVDWSSTLWKH